MSGKSPKIIAEEAYKYLMSICDKLHRRPVLLVDNIGLILGRLDNDKKNKTEQWTLRKLLSENGAPIVVGGGITLTDDVNNYGMPFYDFFQIQQLNKLSYEEFTKLLINLATVTNSDKTVFASIQKNSSRQKSLLEFTGGSPRLTVMLFEQIAKGFSSNIYNDLEILADTITPLYKARFEELPAQQQIILDAIALNWDAISLNKLAKTTRMQNNQLSPQLKRLVDDDWLETTPAYKAKGNAYFISERFFNIYYLIRNSSRRHKDNIYCLSRFLEYFYGKEELDRIIEHEYLRKEFDINDKTFLVAEKAIERYDKATELDGNYQAEWINKGFALIEMRRYEEAALACEKSSSINPKDILSKFYLLFLYRDKLNEMDKAITLFYSITEEDINTYANKSYFSYFYLNKALFELYKRNEGLAKEHLLQAFEVLEEKDELSSMAYTYYWIVLGSVIINLGYGSWLLAILKEKGYDIVLSPYYTAIQALEIETQDNKNGKENAEIYLKNIATEISAPARVIIDKMRRYM
jgi:tetratricopeptide (TPR) repeat protein